MPRRTSMSRAEAAATLGLTPDATPDAARHAWRMWARVAHPDVGGDPAFFARLDEARRVLLQPIVPAPAPVDPVSTEATPAAEPRVPLATVVHRPARPVMLTVLALVATAAAVLPALLGVPAGTIAFAAAAIPAALTAGAWATWTTRQVVSYRADQGHRIVVLSLAWLVIAVVQQAAALAAGASLIPVLPLLALPLAASVSAINPGAGLWRPVGSAGQRP